jgi:site-specific DNA recombinase
MRLVGYIRVSSKSQEDNTSLESQEERIRAYCKAYGHKLVKVYREQESGKDTEGRPEFLAAIEAVKTKADGIIAIKLDRIARNTRDVLELVEEVLQPHNKALILLDLQVDTSTPTGRMILSVMASVAQLEREQIIERCLTGRRHKRAKGGYIGGLPPYGYDRQEDKLILNPQEQEVLDIIRKRSRRGHSLYAIAKYLNEKNYPTKTGAAWSHVLVGKLLNRLKTEAKEAV